MSDTTGTISPAKPFQVKPAAAESRLNSLDMIRGLIMFLMALDHVRIFFSSAQFNPVDPEKTNLLLFLIRWVTHYCAPGFFVIAGIAVFIYLNKIDNKKEVAKYLLIRGCWLIFLELTVIGFAWSFNPGWSWLGVIWSLGWSFLLMAVLIYVPHKILLWGSLAVVFLHALIGYPYFDSLAGRPGAFMAFLYAGGPTYVPLLGMKGVLYSVFPWVAYMSLGFAAGRIMLEEENERVAFFIKAGLMMVAVYAALRLTNFYGNPAETFRGWSGEFSMGQNIAQTIINFLNTSKYPPSPQFALMTLGPLALLLAAWAKYDHSTEPPNIYGPLRIVGRVPFFFYILHLYLIHFLALAVLLIKGQPYEFLIWDGMYPRLRPPTGYGYAEVPVLAIWLGVCMVLYFCSRFYDAYKQSHSHWWLRYL